MVDSWFIKPSGLGEDLYGKGHVLETTRRGHFRLTNRGAEVVKLHLHELNSAFLKRFDAFQEFYASSTHAVATRGTEQKASGIVKTQEESGQVSKRVRGAGRI